MNLSPFKLFPQFSEFAQVEHIELRTLETLDGQTLVGISNELTCNLKQQTARIISAETRAIPLY